MLRQVKHFQRYVHNYLMCSHGSQLPLALTTNVIIRLRPTMNLLFYQSVSFLYVHASTARKTQVITSKGNILEPSCSNQRVVFTSVASWAWVTVWAVHVWGLCCCFSLLHKPTKTYEGNDITADRKALSNLLFLKDKTSREHTLVITRLFCLVA